MTGWERALFAAGSCDKRRLCSPYSGPFLHGTVTTDVATFWLLCATRRRGPQLDTRLGVVHGIGAPLFLASTPLDARRFYTEKKMTDGRGRSHTRTPSHRVLILCIRHRKLDSLHLLLYRLHNTCVLHTLLTIVDNGRPCSTTKLFGETASVCRDDKGTRISSKIKAGATQSSRAGNATSRHAVPNQSVSGFCYLIDPI